MGWKQSLGWKQKVKWIRNNRQFAGWLAISIGITIILISFVLVEFHIKIPVPFFNKELAVPAKLLLGLGVVFLIFGISRLKQYTKRNQS